MHSKRRISKKGSYLVEAVITLPIFLIAVIGMISVILLYACIENANFILANEMRREAIQSKYIESSAVFAWHTEEKIRQSDDHIKRLTITDYLYKGEREGLDELLALEMRMQMHVPDPTRIFPETKYDLSLVTRAYVGNTGDGDPMSAEELMTDDSVPVYIFPKAGEKYHDKSCTFVRRGCESTPLTEDITNNYSSCPLCDSGSCAPGSLVYIFPEYGNDYHKPGCRALERNYIEIDRKTAEERGYTPCSKCGG